MKLTNLLLNLICLLLISSCATKQPFVRHDSEKSVSDTSVDPSNIDYELFLVGDIGSESNTSLESSNIVDLIKSQLKDNGVKKSVVFLGNTFGESGFPDAESPEYLKVDQSIERCIRELKTHTDKVYFIPGSSEWYDGHDYTVSAINQVEDYIQSKVSDKNIFVPSNGCGEPKLVKLSDDLLLVLMDSQWVLQGDDSEERKRSGCDIDANSN